MKWFTKKKKLKRESRGEKRVHVPEGLWIKCVSCGEILYKKEVERSLDVCFKCNHHFRISAESRISNLIDEGSFVEEGSNLEPADPINFYDTKKYKDRIKDLKGKVSSTEAVICGEGTLMSNRVLICAFNFAFMGGSMGSVVGEKITRLFEKGWDIGCSVIIVSSSGGARMQEGILSLMQMAKTSADIAKFKKGNKPFISVLTDPTTGGVTASFAMLGDIIIAEPGALIGFAGPRVIEQTIKEKLPEGFQKSEHPRERGMIDIIVNRKDMKDTLGKLLAMFHSSH